MKQKLALLTFMMVAAFGMGTFHLDNKLGFEPVQIAYAQEASAPAEAPKAEASPEVKAEAIPDSAKMEPGDVEKPLPTEDFLQKLVESVGGAKGLGALGLVALIIQMLALFFRTQLAMFAGKWRLLVIWTLSLVGGVLALKASTPEMSWLVALTHANTLGWAQGWFHQVWKQFVEKKDEKATA